MSRGTFRPGTVGPRSELAESIQDSAVGAFPNLCTVTAGANPVALPVQIQRTVMNAVSYSFALPNDNWPVAAEPTASRRSANRGSQPP